MFRRVLLKHVVAALSALTLGATAVPAAAADNVTPRVDVVKVLSLSCPVCRAAEAHDTAIAQAVAEAGGRFVFAPVPTDPDAVAGARERVYYAARDLAPELERSVKFSLYKGSQDMSVPLNDYLQVYTWLSSDLPELEPRFNAIFQRAQENAAGASLARAARLASAAGVSSLPGYVLLVNGQVAALLDPSAVPGENLIALRDEVIARVRKLSNAKAVSR